jgi:hypothetical protein
MGVDVSGSGSCPMTGLVLAVLNIEVDILYSGTVLA